MILADVGGSPLELLKSYYKSWSVTLLFSREFHGGSTSSQREQAFIAVISSHHVGYRRPCFRDCNHSGIDMMASSYGLIR